MIIYNNINYFKNCLSTLYDSWKLFESGKDDEAFPLFQMFCKTAFHYESLRNIENNIYRKIWKLEGQPTAEISCNDFGRLAFHGLEGKFTKMRSKALEFAYNRIIKNELKKVYSLFQEKKYNDSSQLLEELFSIKLIGFDELLNQTNENTVKNLFLFCVEESLCSEKKRELEINNNNAKVGCYKKERFYSVKNKIKILNILIWKIHSKKFSENLVQRADNYFQRKATEIIPLNFPNKKIGYFDANDIIKSSLEKYGGICIFENHHDLFTHNFMKNRLNFFEELGVEILFHEGLRIENIHHRVKFGRIKVIGMNSLFSTKGGWKNDNIRAEMFNYEAGKIIKYFRQTLSPGKKIVIWVGVGHNDFKGTYTYLNGSSEERTVFGLATLAGFPSFEIRSKANNDSIERWHQGEGDGALQEGFGSKRFIDGKEVSVVKTPSRANFEVYEKLPEVGEEVIELYEEEVSEVCKEVPRKNFFSNFQGCIIL